MTGTALLRMMSFLSVLLGSFLAALAGQVAAQPAHWADWGEPAPGPARVIGKHAGGCIGGATVLPLDGEGYSVMRPSRRRNFGHPDLIAAIEDLARNSRDRGWPGLLVGDMTQIRGGPMKSGHRSHQSGLDADIWLLPRPATLPAGAWRENLSAVSVLTPDRSAIDRTVWTSAHLDLLKTAAELPKVRRIFVNFVVKRELCETAGPDRAWLTKIRPWWGHHYHFHIRLSCPAEDPDCVDQALPQAGDGCGADLAWWFTEEAREAAKGPPPPPMTLADLPQACRPLLAGE